jgi:hypothetical protein
MFRHFHSGHLIPGVHLASELLNTANIYCLFSESITCSIECLKKYFNALKFNLIGSKRSFKNYYPNALNHPGVTIAIKSISFGINRRRNAVQYTLGLVIKYPQRFLLKANARECSGLTHLRLLPHRVGVGGENFNTF